MDLHAASKQSAGCLCALQELVTTLLLPGSVECCIAQQNARLSSESVKFGAPVSDDGVCAAEALNVAF